MSSVTEKRKPPIYVTSYKVTPLPGGDIEFEFSDGSIFIMTQAAFPGMESRPQVTRPARRPKRDKPAQGELFNE